MKNRVSSQSPSFLNYMKNLSYNSPFVEPRKRLTHPNFSGREPKVMKKVRVAFFDCSAQGQPVCQLLSQAGILAELHKESPLAFLWYISRRRAGVRLEVGVEDAERAHTLLRESDSKAWLPGNAVRCPECDSLRIDYPQFTRKSLLTNLVMGLASQIGLVELSYYCEDCHCMWEREGNSVGRTRQHMAPDYFLEDVHREPASGRDTSRTEGFSSRPSAI